MLSYWKNNRLTGIWSTALSLALLYIFPLINLVELKDMVAMQGFFSNLFSASSLTFAFDLIGGFIVLFLIAILACYLVFETKYIDKFNYLPALCILLGVCVFPKLLFLQDVHFALLCMLWVSFCVNNIQFLSNNNVFPFFYAGLASGTVFVIDEHSAGIVIAFIIGGIGLQVLNAKKLLVYILGCLLPLLFYVSYWVWLYGLNFYLKLPLNIHYTMPHSFLFLPAISSGYFVVYFLLVLLIGLSLSTSGRKLSVLQKRQTAWHLYILLFCCISLAMQQHFAIHQFIILLPLIAIIFSKFLWHTKSVLIINTGLLLAFFLAVLSQAAYFL